MEGDKHYHIFNRTNNKELLFKEEKNYSFFLEKLEKYIVPVADIFAYCLLPNHFHFVLRVKGETELETFFKEKITKLRRKTLEDSNEQILSKLIILQFSHFFNSYTQAINKLYSRNGSLFSPNFKRKEINTEEYLRQVIIYVHLNPVNHGVCLNTKNYAHSSFNSILSSKATLLKRNEVVKLFGDALNFKELHELKLLNEELLKEIIDDDD